MIYELNENIATLRMDDGKVNAVGHSFLDEINDALDCAENEAGAIILRGRDGMFSGGFDLKEFQKGPEASLALARRGFELLLRLYSFPLPVIAACTGHGIAMGAFILLASDTRIGARGDFKISLPETAIGMDLTPLLIALTVSRVSKRHLTRAAVQSEVYDPQSAIDAGFLDEVVALEDIDARAQAVAAKLAALPAKYYARNKLAARADALTAMRTAMDGMPKS